MVRMSVPLAAVRDLEFAYRRGLLVLRHISLTAPAKSFIALVGHTGSGKSTLASLMMGYYPVNQGTLLLDSRPIENLSHRVLRQGVAMVQQDPVVMAETVYANETLGRELSEQQVWHALEQVQLAPLVRTLPGGLHAELGEQGNTLSAGQKQLLALARCAPVSAISHAASACLLTAARYRRTPWLSIRGNWMPAGPNTHCEWAFMCHFCDRRTVFWH